MSLAEQMELDLAAILLNDFGVEVVVTPDPSDAGPYTLRGLFDSQFINADMGGIPVEMQDARFSFQTSAASYIYEGCTITVDSVIYDVIRLEADGSLTNSGGMTVAILRMQG